MSRVWLISGGSKGLGLSMVQGFLQQGDVVATFSRSPSEATERLQNHPKTQNHFVFEAIDITDTERLRGFVKTILERFKRLDGLINNAGLAASAVSTFMPAERIDQVLQVNLSAAIKLTQICTHIMLAQNQGVVINISSIIANRGYAGLATYSASKAGLEGMTRSLARELGGKGIRVNAIAPGYIATDMSADLTDEQLTQIIRRTPLNRLASGEDVFNAARFLASNEARNITGQVITVDGGLTC